jgi:hypothetical protein
VRRRWLVVQHSPAGRIPASAHWTRRGAARRAHLLTRSVPTHLLPSLVYLVHRRTKTHR